jgi:hypothetical protein
MLPRLCAPAAAGLLVFAATAPAADKVLFNRDVRPILSEHCFACHGPDAKARKAKLRLDVRESAVEKGAITPGKPADSELVNRILLAADDEQLMPPAEFHKPLTAAQKATLKAWVEQGAEYQPHWAYIVPTKPAVPPVQDKHALRNPVDAFILAELVKRNLCPSPEADKRTLIRRVSLDLTGLPPTPDEVEAFVADKSPDAYEKVVDRLLASPHFGERMAVGWLDLVRFADTVGYHGDQTQRVFPYRDYVIDSFNTNKPFDQFTREQLAGDLLPNPTTEQLVATGFNRLNMMTREGGAQPKEYLAKYQADRVRTVSITWLGSTMGCAECHDHKYDPFTAKDFYAMEAFFADIKQWGVYADYSYTPNPELPGWTNDHPFPPEIEVDSPYLRRRVSRLRAELDKVAGSAKRDPAAVQAWATETAAFLAEHKSGWATPTPTVTGYRATVGGDGRVVFLGPVPNISPAKKAKTAKPPAPAPTLALTPGAGRVTTVKLELLPDPAHNGKLSRDGQPVTVTPTVVVRRADGSEAKVALFFGDADRWEPTRWYNTEPTRGLLNGWRTVRGREGEPHTAVWMLDQPLQLADGDKLLVTLASGNLGAARVSVSPFGFEPLWPPAVGSGEPTPLRHLLSTGHDPAAFARAKALIKDIAACNGGKAWTQVTVPQTPITTRVLPRGNFLDETGPVVQPAIPGFLATPKTKVDRRLTRLDLADWIASKDNPLTARVFVNRLWKQFFGTGLSAVMEDVGAQGEPPSHPELLDWLACEFASDWDVKRAVRLIVTSGTYRQASRARPELRDLDPNNRLLSFQNPRRLEAEFVRDNALAVAGLLNREVGGPSVKPYQPPGYYANLQFPDRDYNPDTDDRQYRRGVYVHWQRTFLQPMLANFDAPSREECTASRTVANTPQQALTLLNDPTFVEAARVLAATVMKDGGRTDADKLAWLYRRVLARGPKPAEAESLLKFLTAQRDHFRAAPADADKLVRVGLAPAAGLPAPELAAWASVCRVVLNLHETITRY